MNINKIKEIIRDYFVYVIICIVFLVLVIGLIVFFATHKGSKSNDGVDTSTFPTSSVEVPKDKYEENAYPEVTRLMESYYSAVMDGKADAAAALCDVLPDQERYRIEEMAKYYQSFSDFNVYTKKGYKPDSYVVIVTFDITFVGVSTPAPSLESTYVCTNESGSLYINKSELTDDEQAYFLEMSSQSDVEELTNKISVKYNEALESDPQLAAMLKQIETDVNAAVKARLTQEQQAKQQEEADKEAEAQRAEQDANAVTVRAKEVVNIRASASKDSDSLGKAQIGDTYKRYEEMENGWSKIDYNGKEAYIKSEYLEVVQSSSSSSSSGDSGSDSSSESVSGGKVTVKENVNVREGASETAKKLGVAYQGEKFDLIEKSNGWCKIKYNGKEAYVKADFVE
ncbi:MAG: SH3 domain-containing protein [Lachnospiraceae bacterium]|nr:SH3 domain-containing protein [Lachnospiraceae bacterium]